VVNYIEKLVRENQNLSHLLQQYLQAGQICGYGLTPILKQVLLNAQKNAHVYPTHSEVITKLTTALLYSVGHLATSLFKEICNKDYAHLGVYNVPFMHNTKLLMRVSLGLMI